MSDNAWNDFWSAVGNFFGQRGPEGPLHSTEPPPPPHLAPDAVQKAEAAFEDRLPHPHLAPGAVEAVEDAAEKRFPHHGFHDDVTRAETPGEQAAQKLVDAVGGGSHLGEPIKPNPSPIDPDLGDPNKPPHPTPIGPGGDAGGAAGHHGLPGIPSVLTQLANGLPVSGHIVDGTSNTISVAERAAAGADLGHTIPTNGFTAALNGLHPAGDLPPPDHGGGVIDPLPPHAADFPGAHVAQVVDASHDNLFVGAHVHVDALHH